MTTQRHGRFSPVQWLRNAPAADYRRFLTAAIRHPGTVGAATPTSNAVANTVARVVPPHGDPVVVELGPGTGSLSVGIRDRLPAAGRHVGIELDESMVRHLRLRLPEMETVHGDARELRSTLPRLGIDNADVIVSSIPWSLLSDEEQRDLLRQCCRNLAPGGAFTAMTYLPMRHSPGGRRFRNHLETSFGEVVTQTTWRSVPPMLHYTCRHPIE
ncbi:Phospholipid N-methyltransferase [Actinopolyspora xinjiangensis]|uniref:Phospholipid N-methyltransferase n=1 Tax=Actinopolyspora xinjiangensis TaxID=405564 RepID=A0A1H0Q4G4_9ACTN|nr:methyltransferase domain-containing protein [Actinopolyspora xinjiangensis]SDP11519.1 Phospholipid N-methyltransferase [Actinopolyspora xinjiangensis]